jgi:phasin family protein
MPPSARIPVDPVIGLNLFGIRLVARLPLVIAGFAVGFRGRRERRCGRHGDTCTGAKGAQDIAAYTVEYGKGAIEKAVADTKRLYAVKTPAEFFSVQSEITKANVDEAVAQVSKFTENYLKLVGEIVQPLQNRYALAAEKVKSAYAA